MNNLFEVLKLRRRQRIIRKALLNVKNTPNELTIRRPWFPTWVRSDYTLRNSELIFSAVSRIANSLSAMPIQLYKGSSPVMDDLNDLLSSSPNSSMTSCQFLKTLEACRSTAGNCYALKIYGADDSLERLDIIDPERVQPILEETSGELWYRISTDNGKQAYFHNYYVIHVPFIAANGISGISPVTVLLNTLQYSDSIQTFNRELLAKGVSDAIVLEAPANLGAAQKQQMIEDFTETYHNTSGNILLLESGVQAKNLALSPIDSKLFEVERITRSKVAMVYNLPPHLLGDYSDTSFSSQEQQTLEFLTLTMLPIVTAYEQEFNRKLLTKEQRKNGYHWVIDMEEILRADAATQAEVDYKAVRSAWKTPDEIRSKRNMPPFPGGIGSKPLVSQDLATLEYTVNEKPKVLTSKLSESSPVQS